MSENAVDVLRVEIRAMSENIAHMRGAVDDMTNELKKISVLEEKHSNHSQAISRAFQEIKDLETAHDTFKVEARKEHEGFKRTIWFSTGFIFAVSVLWTVFGVYLADTVRETVRGVAEMKSHVLDKTIHLRPFGLSDNGTGALK